MPFFKNKYFSLLIFLFFLNCSLFNMRENEEPSNIENFIPLPKITADNVFSNFANSLKYKSIANYELCFDKENFKFYFSAEDISANPYIGEYIGWEDENNAISSIMIHTLNNGNINVLFTQDPENNDEITSDKVIYFRNYNFYIPLNNSTLPNNYHGKMKIEFEKKNNLWYITKIYDYYTDNYKTIGFLKAKFLYNK